MVKNITEILSLFTVISICCGCVITNIYLSSLGLLDYSLLSIQMLYCGVTFLGLLGTTVLFYFLYSDYLKFEKIALVDTLINGFTRGIIIGNLFIPCSAFWINCDESLYRLQIFSFLFIGLKIIQYSACLEKETLFDRMIKWLSYMYSCALAAYIIYNIYNDDQYFNFVKYFISICFFLFAFRLNYCIRLFDRKKGIKLVNPDCFSTDTSINNAWSIADNICGVFIIAFGIFGLAYYYAINVYPFICEKYGGGYRNLVKYELDNNKEIIGKTLKITDNYMYIIGEDNKLHIFQIEKIKSMTKK